MRIKFLPTIRLLGTLQDPRFGKSAASLFVWFILLFGPAAHGDPEWLANPVDDDWFNAANWSTGIVPGPFDFVHFGVSSVTDLELTEDGDAAAAIIFDAGGDSFTITALPAVTFEIFGNVTNNSILEQNFVSVAGADGDTGFRFHDGGTITGPVTFMQQAQNTGTQFFNSVIFYMSGAGGATFHNLGQVSKVALEDAPIFGMPVPRPSKAPSSMMAGRRRTPVAARRSLSSTLLMRTERLSSPMAEATAVKVGLLPSGTSPRVEPRGWNSSGMALSTLAHTTKAPSQLARLKATGSCIWGETHLVWVGMQ
jgi:hypothetical protein